MQLHLPLELSFFRIACDVRSSLCNPPALAELLSRGASVFDVPDVHATVFCGGDQVVACSGFNFKFDHSKGTGAHNEVGIWSCDQDEIDRARAWFNALCEVSI